MKKYFALVNENYTAYFYTSLLLILILPVCISLIARRAKRTPEKTLLLRYLASLLALFVYTDLAFPLPSFKGFFFTRMEYLKSVELLNEAFGIFEIFVGFRIYNLRVDSVLLRKTGSIALIANLVITGVLASRIYSSTSYKEIFTYAELLSACVFATLMIGGVMHFVECFRKNILWTHYSWLAFSLFSYSTLSYLIFPLSIYCYKFLADTDYWRTLNAYHFVLLIILTIIMTRTLAFTKDKKNQLNEFVY